MTDTKFTPGPWRAWQPRGDESVPVRTDGLGITIAYVHQGAITNARANASLIAASPEMFEALDHAEAVMSIVLPRSHTAEYIECLDKIRAALAKARGEA